jgi:hypothetical protein
VENVALREIYIPPTANEAFRALNRVWQQYTRDMDFLVRNVGKETDRLWGMEIAQQKKRQQ